MTQESFINKISKPADGFSLQPKEYSSYKEYMKEHVPTFREFLAYYEKKFNLSDALRSLNKIEREIGGLTAIPSEDEKVSHIKAEFMHDYIKVHLSIGYVEKTFKYPERRNKGTKFFSDDLTQGLNDKFGLGDGHMGECNHGIGVTYKGPSVLELEENILHSPHVDIRGLLDEHIWSPAINIGRQLLNDFVSSKILTK